MPDAPLSSKRSPAGHSAMPRGGRRLVAISGGRGGVGCSVVTVNLAVYLAQLGRKVVLVDTDPSGAQLHTMFGIEQPPPTDSPEGAIDTMATMVPGLWLAPQTYERSSTLPTRPGRKPRWASALNQLDADHVLLDLGAGTSAAILDLFASADLSVCVTTPEPPSVEGTYRFLKALFVRRLRRTLVKDRFKMRLLERAHADLDALPAPQELVRTLARYDVRLGEQAALELSRIRPRLIVNSTRVKEDSELGTAMVDMASRYLGVAFDFAGHIEDDDVVWLSVKRRQPLLTHAPASKSARNLERIARRLLAVATAREQEHEVPPIPLIAKQPTLYDLLLTQPSASDEEVRRAHRRQRDLFRPDSLSITSLVTPEQRQLEQARIDEAHDILLDTLKRRAYDLSTFPDQAAPQGPTDAALTSAQQAERAMLREELAREISPDTVFTGQLLRKVREAQGVEIEDISRKTKITRAHLEAIEDECHAALPATVYLRGFLQQVAKYLGLDPAAVTRSYLARHRGWRRDQEQGT